jgi:HSP20 family protein
MSENNSNHSKQLFTVAVLSILVAIIGFQAWYMVSMKQQLDEIQGKHDTLAAVIKPDSSAPASPVAKKPAVLQRIQKDLNAKSGQQGQSIPADPPSVFDDDLFNRPFFGQNWNPYEEIELMQQEMDRMFSNAFSSFGSSPDFQGLFSDGISAPQMDVQEDDSKYTVIVNLPGAEEKNVSVNLDGQQLTVKGEQDFNQQKKDANGNVIFQQHRSGAFQRSITLPEPVKQNGMVTHVDNGVLTITVPKVS